MISISVKLFLIDDASGNNPEASENNGWRTICGGLSHSKLQPHITYVGRLLERSHKRGIKIESFYITETEKKKRCLHKKINLSRKLIHSMSIHGADFSYGVFSSMYEQTQHSVSYFYILRFRKQFEKMIFTIINNEMKLNGFNVFTSHFENKPYIIFDAKENGLEYFFSLLPQHLKNYNSPPLFNIDYFTNSPWCYFDITKETIQTLDSIHASIKIEIHDNMGKHTNDKNKPLWKHVIRTARKCLKGCVRYE